MCDEIEWAKEPYSKTQNTTGDIMDDLEWMTNVINEYFQELCSSSSKQEKPKED